MEGLLGNKAKDVSRKREYVVEQLVPDRTTAEVFIGVKRNFLKCNETEDVFHA
jgi:hypothetical protein